MSVSEYTIMVRQLNDLHRALLPISTTVVTRGVAHLSENDFFLLMRAVRDFKEFSEDNDPHGEHDFGSIEMGGSKFFWKIDYYAKGDYTQGSDDPSDPEKTSRVLTVMHSYEY